MRRKTDRWYFRAAVALAVLSCAHGLLAAYIGVRALYAINGFNEIMENIRSAAKAEHAGSMRSF